MPKQDQSTARSEARRRWLPKPQLLLGLLVVAALVVLVIRDRSIAHQVATVLDHLSIDRVPWLVAALGAEGLSFLCYALVQRSLLKEGGADLSLRDMVTLAVAATGLTNLLPGGTAPSSGWLVAQYRKREVPLPLALWAVLAGGFAAVVSVLLLTLAGAALADLLPMWAAGLCLLALAGGSIGFLAGFRQLDSIDRWLRSHHLGRADSIVKRASKRVGDISTLRARPAIGARVLVLSIGNWGLDVACLIAAFALLGQPIPWRTVLFAYALAQVAGSLAPVPGGIGFMEGGMLGAFALAGTPIGGAVLATVLYRLITTLGVAGVGSVVLLHLSRKKRVAHAKLSGQAAALNKR